MSAPEPPVIEGPRPPRIDELSAVVQMINHVFGLANGKTMTIETHNPHVYAPANLENGRIIVAGGRVAAHAAIWANDVAIGEARLRVGGISCVATLPEYRRHGFAAQVMAATHQRMAELGCHVGLLGTGITNWYRKLGWERAGARRNYRIDRGNVELLPGLPPEVTVRMAGDADVASLAALRNADCLGGLRTPELFETLWAAKGRRPILLAEDGSGPRAYLVVWEATATEWGGPAGLVAGLVRQYFTRIDDRTASTSQRNERGGPAAIQSMTLTAPERGHPLAELLAGLRLPYNFDYLGMFYLVDPRGLLDAFGLHDVTLNEQDGLFTLGCGGETVTVNRNLLTKLLLGPERGAANLPDVFPLPFWQWGWELV